ncbi:hypothetical protein ACHAWC_003267 [Mediolabrus comicus]
MNRPPQHQHHNQSSSANNIPIIQQPGENDILCGRGGGTNAHSGNIKFRKLVAAHKLRYLAASKSDKPNVARDVVKEWRSMDPPGRFLAKMDMKQMILANLITVEDVKNEQLQLQQQGGDAKSKSKKETKVYWYDVGDKKAREKASQCLRERNGAANEAVAALVKTVTANGESCPEDYATLMDRAAKVKEQQMQSVMAQQQQQQGIGMGVHQHNMMMGGGNSSGGGGYNIDPVLSSGGGVGVNNINNGGGNSTEDDVIEAEIQRLLREKQEQMMMSMGASGGAGGGSNTNRNNMGGVGRGGGGGGGYGDIQPYMGEESILQEYQALLQKQQELDMRLANANAMMNNQQGGMMGGGGGGMMMGGNGGMMGGGYGNQQHNNNMMPQAYQDSPNNNMSPNPNPNAARDYMNRLRMLRQGGGGGGGGMDLPYGDNNNMMGGGGGGGMLPPDNVMSSTGGGGMMNNNNMGNMNNNMGGGNMNGMGGVGGGGGQQFSIEEYQASLQEFLGHDDGGNTGGGGGISKQYSMSEQTQATQQINNTSNTNYGGRTVETIQVPTNLNDGGSRRSTARRNSDRSIDDIDLPIGRNTFKSVDSTDRPSFQSMDDMGIRDTFRSVDTMDLMSIGASLNEIVEEEIKTNPEVRKKYSRRLSASSRHSRYASGNNQGPSLNDFAHLPGATVQVKTLNHGQGGGNGPKKIRKAIDPRLVAMAGKSDGGNKRGSALSTDLDLDGLEDGRMSFGNMSLMSELTDFGDIITKGLVIIKRVYGRRHLLSEAFLGETCMYYFCTFHNQPLNGCT